jgi:Zn-finger nucleic acid-binding protein
MLMKCPTCPDSTLVMTERQGIEIDYCPTCRGVWLDRGELDKLIERSVAQTAKPAAPAPTAPPPQPYPYRSSDSSGKLKAYGHPKRKSWLSDLFD